MKKRYPKHRSLTGKFSTRVLAINVTRSLDWLRAPAIGDDARDERTHFLALTAFGLTMCEQADTCPSCKGVATDPARGQTCPTCAGRGRLKVTFNGTPAEIEALRSVAIEWSETLPEPATLSDRSG